MPPSARRSPDSDPGSRSPAGDPGRDYRLVAAARDGDGHAFGRLVELYGGLVYRVIGRLVSDRDERDDLVQETFYRALKALGSFAPEAEFRPWLLTIALNAARDHLRRRRVWSMVPLDAGEGDGDRPLERLADERPGPDEETAGRELEAHLEHAFRRLPAEAQAILWLRAREELSYAEIATVLGIATGTVMSRLSRARAALRRALEEMRAGGAAIDLAAGGAAGVDFAQDVRSGLKRIVDTGDANDS